MSFQFIKQSIEYPLHLKKKNETQPPCLPNLALCLTYKPHSDHSPCSALNPCLHSVSQQTNLSCS